MLTDEEQQQAIDEVWKEAEDYWLSKGLTQHEAELATLLVNGPRYSLPTKHRQFRKRLWQLAAEDE